MSYDETEETRRDLIAHADALDRVALHEKYGQVWDTEQLCAEFKVDGFAAPFVVVTRKSDGQRGSLEFQHRPRFYFNFQPA